MSSRLVRSDGFTGRHCVEGWCLQLSTYLSVSVGPVFEEELD